MAEGVALPPYPIVGRIPNFKGAEDASRRLLALESFKNASAVKVNPDSPQRHVRLLCLREGKLLVMPTPRLREGFVIIDPTKLDEKDYATASGIRGALALGERADPESIGRIDFVVTGSVAVSRRGARLGKGEGYSEIEYAVLRMLGQVSKDTPIATTVHQVQMVSEIPVEPFDVPIDYILTSEGVVRTETTIPRPQRIIWSLLERRKMVEIPLLRRLMRA